MGIIIRHAGAPYIDGETLPGKDLETDIARAYAEIAGNMDNANVRAAADISATKLLAGSLPGSKIIDNILTSAKIEAGAVVGQKIKDDTLEAEVMAAASLTDSAIDTDSSPPSASTSGVTVASVVVNTGSVQGLIMIFALVLVDLVDTSPAVAKTFHLAFLRGSNQIASWDVARGGDVPVGGSFPQSVMHVDTTYALSSAITYNLKASGDAFVLDDLIFVAVELRR